MKYAIVNTMDAVKAGIKTEHHVLSPTKSRMIVNENELRYLGDPKKKARELGGDLVSRQQLTEQINSEAWNQ